MRSRRIVWYLFPLVILIGIYFLGPQPERPQLSLTLPVVPDTAFELEQLIAQQEAKHTLKLGNEAEIIWNDSTKSKTPYAIVYLHGFSASKMEGDPVHKKFARDFGCNLFLARLSDHGIDTTESLQLFTADRVWESAKEALAIGEKLGDRIILMGTSTGGTLALKLAAEYPDDVHALINLSPNIQLNDGAAFLLNNPWGLYIARTVMNGKYMVTDATEEQAHYWNKEYRLEALTQLQELLESTMTTETFVRITQPTLTLYYYKDEQQQDPTVKVSAILEMHEQLATPAALKQAVAIPEAGAHVIGSAMTSKDVESVLATIKKFAEEKLRMPRYQ